MDPFLNLVLLRCGHQEIHKPLALPREEGSEHPLPREHSKPFLKSLGARPKNGQTFPGRHSSHTTPTPYYGKTRLERGPQIHGIWVTIFTAATSKFPLVFSSNLSNFRTIRVRFKKFPVTPIFFESSIFFV